MRTAPRTHNNNRRAAPDIWLGSNRSRMLHACTWRYTRNCLPFGHKFQYKITETRPSHNANQTRDACSHVCVCFCVRMWVDIRLIKYTRASLRTEIYVIFIQPATYTHDMTKNGLMLFVPHLPPTRRPSVSSVRPSADASTTESRATSVKYYGRRPRRRGYARARHLCPWLSNIITRIPLRSATELGSVLGKWDSPRQKKWANYSNMLLRQVRWTWERDGSGMRCNCVKMCRDVGLLNPDPDGLDLSLLLISANYIILITLCHLHPGSSF